MRRFLTLLAIIIPFVSALAQTQSHNIIIDESSLTPVQKDAISGVTIDKIGVDRSRRACARIKMHINRMTRTEIEGLTVQQIGGVIDVMKQIVATDGSGLIIELTAKEPTRFYLHHDKYGDSNEVSLNLEGNKEYKLSAELKMTYSIVVSSNAIGADIYIDNEYKGRTDESYTLTVNDITPGSHTLKVQYGSSINQQNIDVNSSAIYFRLDVNTASSMAQYVVFEVKPTGATIMIDQTIYPTDEEGIALTSLNNGSYSYEVSANGYHTEKGRITVSGAKLTIPIELRPAHGWLVVESNPVLEDALIYIDDVFIGKAPLKSNNLSSGEHHIKVLKNLYLPYEETIVIKDNEALKFNPTLTANYSTVTLTTAEGADIYVNDKLVGKTNWTGPLGAGTYIFEARKEGHKTTRYSEDISTKTPTRSITLEAPTPINGILDINTTPAKASVKIDGNEVGETPIILNLLVGKHYVTISKSGYRSETKNITIKEGVPEKLTINLEKASAVAQNSDTSDIRLKTITSSPSKADVYIDGTFIGKTPIKYYFGPEKKRIDISKPGYRSETKWADENSPQSLHYVLGVNSPSAAATKTTKNQKTTTIAKSASNPAEKAVNISATNSYSKPAKTNYNYGSYYLGYSKVSTSCNYSELEDAFLFDTGLTFGGKIRSQMVSKLYLNYGFNISYISGSYSESWDGDIYEVSQSLFSMNLPVSISYLIKLGDITFAPYCGINLRYNLLGTEDDTYESYDGENESYSLDLFDDYDMDGCPFSRQQVGLNYGVDIEFDNYVIGISFVGDLTPIYENTDYDDVSATFSMTTFSIGFKF